MLQWLLALALVSLLFVAWGIAVLAVIYGSAVVVSRFPLVGRRGSVPGARTARESVVGRSTAAEQPQAEPSQMLTPKP